MVRKAVLPEWVWQRHANPWSGWTRAATTPVLVYALYHRDWRLLAAAVVWLVVNPAAFAPPERTDSWMTRGVLAEREWLREDNGTVGVSWPNVLNLFNVPVTLYVGWATLRRRPLHAILGTMLLMGLKRRWMDEVIDRTGLRGVDEPFDDWLAAHPLALVEAEPGDASA
jgi:hypothetical protein